MLEPFHCTYEFIFHLFKPMILETIFILDFCIISLIVMQWFSCFYLLMFIMQALKNTLSVQQYTAMVLVMIRRKKEMLVTVFGVSECVLVILYFYFSIKSKTYTCQMCLSVLLFCCKSVFENCLFCRALFFFCSTFVIISL